MRQQIITQVRTWLGTRFHHQGRLKKTNAHKGGVDCIGLITCIAAELDIQSRADGYIKNHDITNYTQVSYKFILRPNLDKHFIKKPVAQIGDILLFEFDKQDQHVAIKTDIGIIHSYALARKVIEHRLDDSWLGKVKAVYSFAGF